MTFSPENEDDVHTWGGGSIKWNCSKSWTPRDLRSRTVLARFVRCISGTVVTSSSSLYCRSVYNLKITNTLTVWKSSTGKGFTCLLDTVHCLRFITQYFKNCVCFVLVLNFAFCYKSQLRSYLWGKKPGQAIKKVTSQNTIMFVIRTTPRCPELLKM
jgi:hypothetical protein